MKDKPWFAIAYMFVVTAFFSSILIGFGRLTRERVEQNQQIAVERAALAVLPIDLPERAGATEIHQTFQQRVEALTDPCCLVTRDDEGAIAGYAVPFAGQGFWAPIKGFLGVDPDGRTLTGIAFYEQNETPGLGAEITQPTFRRQFEPDQKRIMAETGPPLGIVRPGADLESHQVHAVTGATQTSNRLERLINEDLAAWREAWSASEAAP